MLVGAELQQITYQEYLPVVLGEKALGNLAAIDSEYDQNVDPSILNEFATIAFRWNCCWSEHLEQLFVRFGHSIVDNEFTAKGSRMLKDHFFK